MSIVDALTRAKKLAQQNRPVPQPRIEEPVAPVASDVTQVHAPLAVPVPPPPRPAPAIKKIEGARVELDVTTCINSRLLVPGSEETLDRKVESAFRMLRTRLLQRARTNGWTTIGVTSAGPNDGKTLTSINLALSIAREKSNEVFVLDLDMRNQSVCGALGIVPKNNMREYFEGTVPADDIFMNIGIGNLLVAAGLQNSERSSELLANAKFEELIDFIKASSVKPIVIIDLPPVVTTDDALVLAPRLDAILLVTSEGKTARDQLDRAVDLLSDFRLVGYVLNRSQQAAGGYYGTY